jgi:hypothetical protein
MEFFFQYIQKVKITCRGAWRRKKIEKQFDLNAWLMLPMGEMKYNCWTRERAPRNMWRKEIILHFFANFHVLTQCEKKLFYEFINLDPNSLLFFR